MKLTSTKKILSLLLCVVLIAVMVLFATGSGEKPKTPPVSTGEVETTSISTNAVETAPIKMGQGEKQFTFKVTGLSGETSVFEINTDKVTVGEALMELDLIRGEDGPYGLYVKTVNGTTVDYDKDGKYWAFYVNDEYAVKGIELTEIEADTTYELKAE